MQTQICINNEIAAVYYHLAIADIDQDRRGSKMSIAHRLVAPVEYRNYRTHAVSPNPIGSAPCALELRRLQTITEIGVEHNSTIVAMLPVELLHAAQKIAGLPLAASD